MSSQPPELPIEAMLADDRTGSLWHSQGLPSDSWSWRELAATAGLVAVLDLAIYRGHGYAGYALLFLVAPALLLCGARWPLANKASSALIAALLLGLAARSLWCGNVLATWCGLAGLVALAYQAAGHTAFVFETAAFGLLMFPSGLRRAFLYQQMLGKTRFSGPRVDALAVGLPLAALLTFGTLFVLANPDVVRLFSDRLALWVERLTDWLGRFSWGEIAFCTMMAVIALGMLRPSWTLDLVGGEQAVGTSDAPRPSAWYAPVRNTLWAVNLLFVAYLAFEFRTLWFRTFPAGFHYSGYAHQGAAWLTVALALATAILSVFFRGELLADPRLSRLKKLGSGWALLNVLLAAAVYHRMWIYVGFNGMTRMRTVGLLGTTAVVGGLLLVLWKISRGRNFFWLLRRQLWVLAAMVYLYAVLPVDRWVTDYNVWQMLAGNLAPSVQISEHANSAEGYLRLSPLLECQDETIRKGVRALLSMLHRRMDSTQRYGANLFNTATRPLLNEVATSYNEYPVDAPYWSAYQIAHERLRAELVRRQTELSPSMAQETEIRDAWNDFRSFAYQWY